jgi:adhesin/invasin
MNGDGTIDASHQPAAPGSVIAVYATGLGPVNPPIPQGTRAPASPLSVATLPITATIGGRQAVVTYAGAAPGLVGTYQVNILVPALTPSGANRLLLSAGGNFSQDGVRVQIR